jgi:hypothetical protein
MGGRTVIGRNWCRDLCLDNRFMARSRPVKTPIQTRLAVAAGRAARRRRSLLVAGLAGLLAACSPALDWRELRPEGFGLALTLPCRPALASRRVTLAGEAVALELQACTADQATFAMASAPLTDPAAVPAALDQLASASLANVDGRIVAEQPAQVPGMTPQAGARRLRISGRLRDGQDVEIETVVFAHGLRVYQASVVGGVGRIGEGRQAFFDSLRVVP